MTLADIVLFCSISTLYQVAIDGGFMKAVPKLANWLQKMASLPVVTRRLGYVKGCQKTVPVAKK